MSNFLKKGQRLKAAADKKEVKKRVKEVYKIIPLPMGATRSEIASQYTDRPIEGLEKMLILGKVYNYYENQRLIQSQESE